MYTSFVRYIFPTLALSKSGFRVETESRLLSAGFHQLPVSNIKVVLVLLCIRTGENARENSEKFQCIRNFTLHKFTLVW